MAGLAPKYDILDESVLIARAQARDAGAVASIIRRHNRRLYRIARSILRNDADAEDALQDAYIRAFGHLSSFRGEAQLGTWLARIVVNEALSVLRRKKQTAELDTVCEDKALTGRIIPFPNSGAQTDPETHVAQRQIQWLLEQAIDALPDAFRAILVARLIEGMSIEETAELFGIPPETVKTRLHRARRLLKKEMEQQVGPILCDAFPFAGRRCERLTQKVIAHLGLS